MANLGSDDTAVEGESLNVDALQNKSAPESYHVFTDGSNITAVPQNNQYDSGVTLEVVEGTDIGVVDDELRINQLPPQGEPLEANGHIYYKRGEYPGDASNGEFDGLALVSGIQRSGESVTHDDDEMQTNTIPTTVKPTTINFSSRGMATPNVNTDFMIYPMTSNIELVGPGAASNGSVGIEEGSNVFDWGVFRDVVVQRCQNPVDITRDGMKSFYNSQFRKFPGRLRLEKRAYVYGSTAVMDDGAYTQLAEAKWIGGGLHGGGSRTFVDLGDGAVVRDVRLERISEGTTPDTAIDINGSAKVSGLNIIDDVGTNFDRFIAVKGGDEVHVGPNSGLDNADRYADIVGGTDVNFVSPAGGGFNIGTTTRPRFDGVIGGGQLGGVDLTSVSGAYELDAAVSDGTAAGFPLGTEARWDDGNGQWVRVDGQATVTPT